MVRGQITLLPGSRDAAAVASLLADYPALYVVADDAMDDHPATHFTYPPLLDQDGGCQVPVFPPEQIAAVLFTSGSTGRPNPSPRRWGRLVTSSLAAGAALGIKHHRGAAVVATVPHAHSYGLEFAVMLPLQHGLLLTADRPFFPADVASALTCSLGVNGPGLLVTTPVHLRTLVLDAAPSTHSPELGHSVRAGFVLSATAPLSAALAAQAETTFCAPVFEIYGCSEAGQLATRRTITGPVWRCLKAIHLHQDAAGTWASGPHEDDVLLGDALELVDDKTFTLLGRMADMVNIAGKRGSLAYLTSELMAIDGVEDGVFLMPDDGAEGVTSRLAAVVVAPGLDPAAILSQLRNRIDPAFLPRPLHIVNILPRNALGKLTRSEILDLLKVASARPTHIMFQIAPDHPASPGHFPGNPIVPGAVLLDTLVAALFPDGWSGAIEAAKFHYPVRPGDKLSATHTIEDGAIRFKCWLANSERLVLSGAMRSPSPPQ